ncbi:MAG: leucine-rich repeat protein, partial [Syntrophomonadaceae bacterium]|nr:leucine-rich repeat protein [Syntrophomonadaceae bacterium]
CSGFTGSLTIGNSVASIGDGAFRECDGFTGKLTIPNSVTSIGVYAFEGCSGFTGSLTIGNSVASIGHSAFVGCGISSFSVASANQYYCNDSYGVLFDEDMTTLIQYPSGNPRTSYALPDSVISIDVFAFLGRSSISSFSVPSANQYYCTDSYGVLFNKDMTTLVQYPSGNPGTSYALPDSVISIGDYAFESCSSLKGNVTIPASVTSIGLSAFDGCSGIAGYYFCGDAPSVIHYMYYARSFPADTTLYYILGKNGWDNKYYNDYTGTWEWNGFRLETWDGSAPSMPSTSLSDLGPIDYLALSDLAYSPCTLQKTVKDLIGNKWSKIWKDTDIRYSELFAKVADWKVLAFEEKPTETGFAAVAFVNNHNEVVIAYRGSEPNPFEAFTDEDAWNDWIENDYYMQILDVATDRNQIPDAINFYDKIAEDYDKDKIVTTGHSLGGALGDIVSAYSGCKGHTFNSVSALLVAYAHFEIEMSKNFKGVDEWDFVDYINQYDVFAGQVGKELKPYKELQSRYGSISYLPDQHSLKSLVEKGTPALTKELRTYEPSKGFAKKLSETARAQRVFFGASSDDVLLFLNDKNWIDCIMYGGDGDDRLESFGNGYDRLIGGNSGNYDILDGGLGDDTYIYYKGNGKQYIFDVGGFDKIKILGLGGGDTIAFDRQTEHSFRGGKFRAITLNSDPIIFVSTNRGATALDRFSVVTDNGTETIQINGRWNSFSSYNISCPVDIDIYDTQGQLVLTLEHNTSQRVYTDYGNFYVYFDEDGECHKRFDLIDGYTAKIRGVDSGTMDVAVLFDSKASTPATVYGATYVPVTASTIATVGLGTGAPVLSVDPDGTGTNTEQIQMNQLGKTIIFDPNGGNVYPVSAQTGLYDKLDAMPTIIRNGYTFDGWYTALTGGDKVTTDTVFTADTTIYAHWKHNIIATAGTGGTIAPSGRVPVRNGSSETFSITADSNYYISQLLIDGVNASGYTFSTASNATTYTFTNVTEDHTIDAVFAYRGGGGGSSPGGGGGGGGLATTINSGNSVTTNTLDQLIAQKKTLTVKGENGAQLVFSTEALKGIDEQATGSVKFEVKDVSAQYADTQPGKRVFSLTVISDGKEITKFNGTVTISLPYELKAGEKAEDVTVWYLAADGTMTEIPCTYDPQTKLVTFTVNHFSRYMVGVSVSGWVNPFTDVNAGDWFYGAVQYVNENGLMQGTDVTTFEPYTTMSRAMLVTVL